MTDANNGHDPTLARWNEGHNSAMEMMKPQIAERDKRLEELKIEFDKFMRAAVKQLATARNEALEEAAKTLDVAAHNLRTSTDYLDEQQRQEWLAEADGLCARAVFIRALKADTT